MRYLFSSLCILSLLNLNAQHFCSTTEMQNRWFSEHPELKADFEKHQQKLAELDRESYKTAYQNGSDKSVSAGTYTIPIVLHILHTGGSENISDAQVIDAVNILTRDFNKTNADTAGVVAPFKSLIGNTQFDFVLASKDPNGNCTNGIIRYNDIHTDWSGNFSEYAYTWPPTRYLNIYVVRSMGGGAAGYTYLPGSGVPAAMDAIVILNSYVGSIGTGNLYTSRALTHEVGHWFDLPHVWGFNNQPGVACGDDGISDTPISKGYTSCNLNNAAQCTPGVVENVQNYMEYAYCPRMFTIGQANRMQTTVNSFVNGRNNLSTPANLALTGITNPGTNCVPNLDIFATPSYTVCSGRTLKLSSVISNASASSYSWSASNSANFSTPGSATTLVTFNNPGLTIVNCVAANPNGSATKSISILVLNGISQINSSSTESFEASALNPPSQWNVVSPTNPAFKWEVINGIGSNGVRCMYVPGETFPPDAIAILESPSYDFKNNPEAVFSFKYAYAKESNLNNDLFKVQASKNCGGTWADVWVPSNNFISQGSGGITSELYLLPFEEEWKTYDLTAHPNFLPFKTEENVRIRFYFQEDMNGVGFGNRFYLDQVSFSTPVGLNEFGKSIELSVYPVPSHSAFTVHFNLQVASRINYQVISVAGAILISHAETLYSEGSHNIVINNEEKLNPGIYFLNVELNGIKMTRKLIVQ